MNNYKIICGDNIKAMQEMESNSIHNCICDPPWGINFLSKDWDNFSPENIKNHRLNKEDTNYKSTTKRYKSMMAGEYTLSLKANLVYQDWTEEWAKEVYRILFPGGFLIAQVGTRTWHRLCCGIENAGFSILDTITWITAQGFPKSHKITNKLSEEAIKFKGWQTPQLKPAVSFFIIAQKKREGTYANNMVKYNCGCFNIDACRIGNDLINTHSYAGGNHCHRPPKDGADITYRDNQGRFPSNLILQEGEVCEQIDKQSNGASRFYFHSKASKKEKNAGLENFEEKPLVEIKNENKNICPTCKAPLKDGQTCKFHPKSTGSRHYQSRCKKCGKKFNGSPSTLCKCPGKKEYDVSAYKLKNNHPTVQSIDVYKYIISLVSYPGTTILDPYCGSGTTGCAAMALNNDYHFIGIEKDSYYCKISESRIKFWKKEAEEKPEDIFAEKDKISIKK